MDTSVTESIEVDITGFGPTQYNQSSFLESHSSTSYLDEHLALNAYFAQEASLREAMQVNGSRQACTTTNSMHVGQDLKDISGPISVSTSACIPVPSELHGVEGAAKELSSFLGSSYSTVFSDSLGSVIHDMRSPEQHAVSTWHKQTPGILQKSQNYQVKDMETSKETLFQGALRVVRPPGDGRGKNHMLPRYWPRMTERELELLTTQDSNCKITPLFEKVLSASDAGKVGRLVLPKACAEAYFPSISQPEGVPLIVQDIAGKEWVFQFRFWPNNNSRMYVLEGITPCIQSMNLQAGDTVIFSRLDPEGKLVMGYRRAPNTTNAEENQKPIVAGSVGPAHMRMISSGCTGKVSTNPSLTKLLMQTEESSMRVQGCKRFGQLNVRGADNGYKLCNVEKFEFKNQEESFTEHLPSEKRKAKDVASKTKRQQIDAEKVEFRKYWEAAQNLLRSPPNVTPSVVTIEGYDFEEYEEPPVFGKEIMPITSSARSVCSGQVVDKEGDGSFLQDVKDEKDGKNNMWLETTIKKEDYCGLETLASVATTEGNSNDSATTSASVTTKHPRHRAGCSCIVCIQPPSGQGPKHKPNCDCNVCLTVKRRFQTLMLRRKKLQSERAAETAAQRNHQLLMDSSFEERKVVEPGFYHEGSWQGCMSHPYANALAQCMDGFCNAGNKHSGFSSMSSYPVKGANSDYEQSPSVRSYPVRGACSDYQQSVTSKGTQLDLNSQPDKEEEMNRSGLPVSMKRLLQSAGYPLDAYLKEQGLTSLVCHDQGKASLESLRGDAPTPRDEDHEYSLSAVVFMNSDCSKVQASVKEVN